MAALTYAVGRYRTARTSVWSWADRLNWLNKAALAGLAACLIGLLAQVRIALPWDPVPLTGQTFGVLLAGALLGKRWGAFSLALYAALGLAGVPWFTGATGGLGITTGYIIGFILAGLMLGYILDLRKSKTSFPTLFGLMLAASLVIYLCGSLWLGAWMSLVMDKSVSVAYVFNLGVAPFIPSDILKAAAAAGLASALLPGKNS